MTWIRCGVAALGLLCACAPKTEEGDGEGGGSGSEEGTSASADASAGNEVGGNADLEHGIVKLQLLPSEAGDAGVFAGTVSVEITMYYDECLAAFYTASPDDQMNGVAGETVFGGLDLGGEGWKDRLCQVDVGGLIDCSVTSFEQELNDMSKLLTVTLAVTGELPNRIAPFGPLPTAEKADCAAGELPLVRLNAPGNVRGRDANGTILWHAESFSPFEAVTDQGTAIGIRAAPP
jgi:hypothetical protein